MSDMILQAELEAEREALVTRARNIEIATAEDADSAGVMVSALKTLARKIEAAFAAPIKRAYEAHRAAIAARDRLLSPVKEAETIVASKIAEWHEAQERARQEAIARAAKEAEERAKAAKAAEAEALAEAGYAADAAAIMAEPVAPEPIPDTLLERTRSPAGVSVRYTWDFEVVDVAAIPREYLVPDLTKIRRVVQALGDQANIPGIVVRKKAIVSKRAN